MLSRITDCNKYIYSYLILDGEVSRRRDCHSLGVDSHQPKIIGRHGKETKYTYFPKGTVAVLYTSLTMMSFYQVQIYCCRGNLTYQNAVKNYFSLLSLNIYYI